MIGETATVEVDSQTFIGRVYYVRPNGWLSIETPAGHIASGPRASVAVAAAAEIADDMISVARASVEPVAFVTGNSFVPALRSYASAEAVWMIDDDNASWEELCETLTERLEAANVLMDAPEYDNALYVVDLARFEYVEDGDGDSLQDDWAPVPRPCSDCGGAGIRSELEAWRVARRKGSAIEHERGYCGTCEASGEIPPFGETSATPPPPAEHAIVGEVGTSDTFETVPLTGVASADIATAIEHEHRCDDAGCDISRALEDGYPFWAAQLLTGATETPLLDEVIAYYCGAGNASAKVRYRDAGLDFGAAADADRIAWLASDTWTKHATKCDACEAYTFGDDSWTPDRCSNCLAPITSTLAKYEAAAHEAGVDVARCAASWITDGNDSDESRAIKLQRIEDDGAGSIVNYPNLSGEWSGDPTPLSLARDITGEDDPDPDTIDAIADAFDEAVTDTFGDACEAELRAWLPAEPTNDQEG